MSMRCMSCKVGSRQAKQPSHATKLIKPCTRNFSRSDTIGNGRNLLLPREISQCKCDCGSPIKWEKTPPRLAPGNRRAKRTSGAVGLPTSSNADSLTDNGRPVRELEKLGAQARQMTSLALVRATFTWRTSDPVRMWFKSPPGEK